MKRMDDQEAVVEAVPFTMGKSVEVRQLAAALETDSGDCKKGGIKTSGTVSERKRGMQIIELERRYQMCTRAEYYPNLIRVASAPKKQVLTEVVLETLSIIAYKQPITKMEIEKIRGVKSDYAVNKLVEIIWYMKWEGWTPLESRLYLPQQKSSCVGLA